MGEDPRDLEEAEELERAMRGVEPLTGRPERVLPRRRPVRRPRPRTKKSPRFEIERVGEGVRGWAPGVDRRKLVALSEGAMEIELSVDLHGLREEEARRELAATLERAIREGRRCLRIIHGRGLSSVGPPVLKEAVLGWLKEPPAAFWVLAFASAPPRLGGTGALLVWLRRPRPETAGR